MDGIVSCSERCSGGVKRKEAEEQATRIGPAIIRTLSESLLPHYCSPRLLK